MKAALLLLIVLTTTGAWAQSPTTVSTEEQLTDAIGDGAGSIQLTKDIQLSAYLDIDGKTVAIDLNGHKLSRSLDSHSDDGYVILTHNGSNLTLTSPAESSGTIEGGKADNGGAIYIPHGNTVTAENVTFRNNSAADHAGAIWNNGVFTATNCTFENNTALDVGAIYNSVTSDGAGNATLKDCTCTGNAGRTGAGALANAIGATVMTIDGGSITGNTAGSHGGGIWKGGTLNMQGAITLNNNTKAGGLTNNVYLKTGTLITVTGSLVGSSIGVEMESRFGTFTTGYDTYHPDKGPQNYFTADLSVVVSVGRGNNREASLLTSPNTHGIVFVDRKWDYTNHQVVNEYKVLTASMFEWSNDPRDDWYKDVSNAPEYAPNEWFLMGGYGSGCENYVVSGNVTRETIVVRGSDVHLILCDNSTLTLTGGLKLEHGCELTIHCQSYGSEMGRLIITNKYENAAGIGSAWHEGVEQKAGRLFIDGGHIEATGGAYGAGIGACSRARNGTKGICNDVYIYGGYVKAIGGEGAAGIGGGNHYEGYGVDGGSFTLYDGTVIAEGTSGGAGVGGGPRGFGGEVNVYGGSLTAIGGAEGAGIGSGTDGEVNPGVNTSQMNSKCGGTFTMNGGTVTAKGGIYAAGIGGGRGCGGAEVVVNGGTLTAYGGKSAAGIGGGYLAMTYIVTINGGTVIANGGEWGPGIGNGQLGVWHNYVAINGGTVIANGGEWAAGIGGGYKSEGCKVIIKGGMVKAKAGAHTGEYIPAIGKGFASEYRMGDLTVGDVMTVAAGNDGAVERVFEGKERADGCRDYTYAEISPCTHPESTYTVSGTSIDDTHTLHCRFCTTNFPDEKHDFDEDGECRVCHLKGTVYTVTIYLPDADEDGVYAQDGVYKKYTYKMVDGTTISLPGAPQDLKDLDFSGWYIYPHDDEVTFESYKASSWETLHKPNEWYTIERTISLFARYKAIDITLYGDSDNNKTINHYNGKKAASVTIIKQIYDKDGKWNTVCLPFALTDGDETDGVTFSGTPFEGATVLTLSSATFQNCTLTLNYEEVTAIEPGKPYLIKWAKDKENPLVAYPVFHDVTICNTSPDEMAVSAGIVTIKGLYAPLSIGFKDDDKNKIYLGEDNMFHYPNRWVDLYAFNTYISFTNSLLGDVNGDHDVNVTDVTVLMDRIMGHEVDGFNQDNADVTRDGDISVTDVTALVDHILGGKRIDNIVVNGADGLTFGGDASVPSRARNH